MNSQFFGTSDEGDLFLVDWTSRPTDENPKGDMVLKVWSSEKNYRPCVGVDRSRFFEDITLVLYDFHFCIYRSGVDVPLISSMIIQGAHITCGGFSPHRPGIIIIGRSDGNLDIWDLVD